MSLRLQQSSRFNDLTLEQCTDFLKINQVGRIGWNAADGPQILPITYAYFNNGIVFRTSPFGLLSELIRPCDVAFEVDDLDQQSQSGWSVVLRGKAEAVAQPQELAELWTLDDLIPWAAGVRNLFIHVGARRLTGKIVAADTTDSPHDD